MKRKQRVYFLLCHECHSITRKTPIFVVKIKSWAFNCLVQRYPNGPTALHNRHDWLTQFPLDELSYRRYISLSVIAARFLYNQEKLTSENGSEVIRSNVKPIPDILSKWRCGRNLLTFCTIVLADTKRSQSIRSISFTLQLEAVLDKCKTDSCQWKVIISQWWPDTNSCTLSYGSLSLALHQWFLSFKSSCI